MGESRTSTPSANPFQAAEVAAREGRHAEAGHLFLTAQRPYEAAVCFQRGQDLRACFEALLQVPPSSPNYRAACVHAARLAHSVNAPLADLAGFALHFLVTPPTSPSEAAAMKEIGWAVGEERTDFAIGVYQRVVQAFPNDAEAVESLAELQARPPPELPVASSPSGIRRLKALDRTNSGHKLGELLLGNGRLTIHHLQILMRDDPRLADDDRALGDVLVVNGLASETQVLKTLTKLSGIPYIGEGKLLAALTPEMAKVLNRDQSEQLRVVPVGIVRRQLFIAMRDPRDWELIDQIRFTAGVGQLSGIFASEACIRKGQRKLYYGEEPEASVEDELWDMRSLEPVEVTRFSDKVTKTREREFDTLEMEKRALLNRVPEEDEAMVIERGSGIHQVSAPPPILLKQVTPTPFAPPPGGVTPAFVFSPSSTPAPQQTQGMPGTPDGQLPMLRPGAMIAGRYKVHGLLGQGGSAVVYSAQDVELGEKVAIKLFGTSADAETMLARYRQELSLARKLAHPNIIRLYDLGQHDGLRYLSMELLDGKDLSAIMELAGPPPLRDSISYLIQACAGLQAAHSQGIIHRDVKPQNLFVTGEGTVKLVDFGLAKKELSSNITVAGMIAGTPDFMSPEQINDFSNVTHHTDLYALGATAYMLFTGAPPFAEEGLVQLLMAHAQQAPASMRERVPAIPEALDAVVLKLLQKSPEDRYQSAAETAEALRQVLKALD